MDAKVDAIINTYRAPQDSAVSGTIYTKTSGIKQRFAVIPQRLGEYLDTTCENIYADEERERGIFVEGDDLHPVPEDPTAFDFTLLGHSLHENVQRRTIPVMVMMKFPFNLTEDQRIEPSIYDESFLIKTAHSIQRVLVSKLNVGSKFTELTVLVEESRLWTLDGTTYLSINFIFPYCQVDVNYQKKRLLPYITEYLRQSKVLAEMYIQPTVDWPVIIQEIGDTIPMYRGKMEPTDAPAKLNHIYGPITDTGAMRGEAIEHELTNEIFNPTHFHFVYSKAIPDTFLAKDVDLDYWLPLFRSIYFWPGETGIKEVEAVQNSSQSYHMEFGDDVTSGEAQVMVNYLMPLLSVNRFKIEPFWKDVAQCLFNIFRGDEKGLHILIQYSEKVEMKERDRNTCMKYYRTLREDHLTIKTIAWYAREDSPEGYKSWHNHWSKNVIFEALSLIHDDVAHALYRVFWLEHIWIDGKRWMMFDNHRLIQQSDAVDLRRDITKKLVPIYKNMRAEFQEMSSKSSTAVDTKQAEAYIKQITNLIEKLGNHGYKTTIIKAAQPFFEVKNFDTIKDSDHNKTGWRNCVIVCSGDHAYTVDGKLEDFITKSTFQSYRADFTWDHPVVKELLQWFYMMFPDKKLTHFMFKDIASYLYGRNAEKILRAWCGDGNNSKTMLAKCVQYAFGLYCIDFPPSFLTGKSTSSSGPSPELAQANGAHVGFVPETEDDEKVREGTAKRATGGDRQYARNCNENGGPMEMMAKVILMCNKIPEFTTISKALINRFMYVPFLGTWSLDAPESVEEQFATRTYKLDPFFENRLPDLAQALAWVAVQYYPHYKKEGLEPPEIIREYTERHWEENDPTLRFIQERLETVYLDQERKNIDTARSLTCNEIYSVFKAWFSQSYPGAPLVTQPTFKANLEQRIGKPGQNGRWYGIAIIHQLGSTSYGGGGDPNTGKGDPTMGQLEAVRI